VAATEVFEGAAVIETVLKRSMTSLSMTSTTVVRLSKKHRMYLRSVSPCSYFTIARSMRVAKHPMDP
jgi:hypothetical protein